MKQVILAAALLCAGCGEQAATSASNAAGGGVATGVAAAPVAPASAPAPAAAAAPGAATLGGVSLSQPIRAYGTEPFWTFDITPTAIVLRDFSIGEGEPQTLPYAAPTVAADRAVWRTRTADGRPVTITLTPGECNEAGEESSPLTARVEFAGRSHPGCAGPARPESGPSAAG